MTRSLLPSIALSLAVASLAPLAATAQTIPDRHATGLIWWVDRGAITLQNRRTIFLKHGTQIEPRGARLEVGQRIVVQGDDAQNGNLDATAIRIVGENYGANAGYGSWYGGRDDLAAATIRSQARAKPHVVRAMPKKRRATPARHVVKTRRVTKVRKKTRR